MDDTRRTWLTQSTKQSFHGLTENEAVSPLEVLRLFKGLHQVSVYMLQLLACGLRYVFDTFTYFSDTSF